MLIQPGALSPVPRWAAVPEQEFVMELFLEDRRKLHLESQKLLQKFLIILTPFYMHLYHFYRMYPN